MRLCFISYEYPPDTGIGGIATYVYQAARLFSQKNINIQVICAGKHEGTTRLSEFLSVTKIKCNSTEEFRKLSPVIAAQIHGHTPFDMIEVPEYGAEGLHIKDQLPAVPLIIKLHTPKFLIKELNDFYYNQLFPRRLKKMLGLRYQVKNDPEYKAIQLADHILSPSLSLKKIIASKWNIPENKIIHAPNPYFPPASLLQLPASGSPNTVLYMGRLETRKGVYNLAKAVPLVVKQIPTARFIFLGKDSRGPHREPSMKKVMIDEMGNAEANVTFIDHVPMEQVPSIVAKAGTCVFPSLWENFPNVCLEAMSAGKKIVASREGGMKDMLEDINGGILVDPHDIQSIADGIVATLLADKNDSQAVTRNREKVLNYYGNSLVDNLLTRYSSFAQTTTKT